METFDYPEGPIAGKNGGTFWDYKNFAPTGHDGLASNWNASTGAPTVNASALVTNNSSAKREYNGPGEGFPPSDEADGAVNDPASPPSSVLKSVYYRVTFATGATLPSFIRISSLDFGTEIASFGTSLQTDDKQFGYQIHPTNSFFTSNTALTPNTTYTVVVRLDYANNQISLFLNPDLNAFELSSAACHGLSMAITAPVRSSILARSRPGHSSASATIPTGIPCALIWTFWPVTGERASASQARIPPPAPSSRAPNWPLPPGRISSSTPPTSPAPSRFPATTPAASSTSPPPPPWPCTP